MISVRIVDISYYMCYPIANLDVKYSEFRGVEVRQVPVIQIYGTSQTGHKTCLNVHDVFPYVYIPYDASEPAGNLSYKIATELDKALNISLGQAASNAVHIHNIVLVSGIPFYGYHERKHQFFKIYFYNPALVKKACSLLENGAILGKTFQPFESHINYILQFMIDFNLHGMSFINISRPMFRLNPDYPELLDNIPSHMILPNDIQRRSVCKLELDVLASNIKNKDKIASGKLTSNPGIAALWEDEKQRRRNKEMDSQISFSLTQERDNIRPTASHLFFEEKLANKLSGEFKSDESSLDKSIYPAETPEDGDLLFASAADHTILDPTSLDETIKETQTKEYDENDAKLLAVLQNLKETAGIEEDSILSQQIEEPENESSDNEEDHNLSLLNKDVNDDDSIWENTFWDGEEIFNQIPQIDGQFDIDSSYLHQKNLNVIEYLPMIYNGQHNKNEYRHASEVYIYSDLNIPESMKLNPGMNKLILSERRPKRSPSSVTILSDVCIKSAEDSNSSVRTNKTSESDYEPLYILDDNCNFTYKKEQPDSEVVINDVSLITEEISSSTPDLCPKWDDNTSETSPIFDTIYQTQLIEEEEEALISQFGNISTENDNTCKEEPDTISNKKGEKSNIENDKKSEHDTKTENSLSTADIKNVSVIPKGKGRPPKNFVIPRRKRGRHPKKRNKVKSNIKNDKIPEDDVKTTSDCKNEPIIPKRKRGRPPKKINELQSNIENDKKSNIKNDKIPEDDVKITPDCKTVTTIPKRKRGRPPTKINNLKSNIESDKILKLKPNIGKTNLHNLRSLSSHKSIKRGCNFCGNCDNSNPKCRNNKSDIDVKVPSKVYHISMSDIRSQNFLKNLKKMSPERDKILNEIELNNINKVEVIVSIKKENFSENEILQGKHLQCDFNFMSTKHDEQMDKKDELTIDGTPSAKVSSKNETSTLSTSEYPNCLTNEEITDLIDNLKKILEEHSKEEKPKCDTIDYLPKVEETLETDIFAPPKSSSESKASDSLETPKKIENNSEKPEIVKCIDKFVDNSNTDMLELYVEDEINRMTKISNDEAIVIEKPSVLDETKACDKVEISIKSPDDISSVHENLVAELKKISLNEDKISNTICSNNNENTNNQKHLKQTENQEIQNDSHSFLSNANKCNENASSDKNINQIVETKKPSPVENSEIETESSFSSNEKEYKVHISCFNIEDFEQLKNQLSTLNLYGLSDSPSSTCTSTSDEEISLKFKKVSEDFKLLHLDGQADSHSNSDSSNQQLKIKKKLAKKKSLCRLPGLSKKLVKKVRKNKKTSVINNSHEKNLNVVTTESTENSSLTENRSSENTEEDLDKNDNKKKFTKSSKHKKAKKSNNILEQSQNPNNSSKIAENGITEPRTNDIIHEINKKELQVVLVPLQLQQETDSNVNPKIRQRRSKSNSFTNNSTDSLDIEQPDKKLKTDFDNLASTEETIPSTSFIHSEKLKESANVTNVSLNRSITKHLVLCSSSSSDETTATESKKVKPVRRRNIRRNRLSTKKIPNSSKMLADQQSEISSTSQNVINSSKQSEMIKNTVKLSEKLKNNETNELVISKNSRTKNSVNVQQEPSKNIELRTRRILTEKEPPDSPLSVINTEKNVLSEKLKNNETSEIISKNSPTTYSVNVQQQPTKKIELRTRTLRTEKESSDTPLSVINTEKNALSEKLKTNEVTTSKNSPTTNAVNVQQQPTKKIELRTRTILTEKEPSDTPFSVINSEKNVLSEKLKTNETSEVTTSKNSPTTNSVNVQQQPSKKIELRTRTILTEKEPPDSSFSVINTEKNVFSDDCDEIFPVSTSRDLCKNAVVVLEQLSLVQIKEMTIPPEKKENKRVYNKSNKTAVNKLCTRSKERIRKIKSENTSPVRNKKRVESPKYSPLNVIIRSPKKHANLTNSEYEPDIKKLKNNSTDSDLNRNADKTVTRSRFQLTQGTGELQFIPILRDPQNITSDITISKNFEHLSEDIKSPDTIKKNLFNTRTEQSNTTLVEEFKTCEYKKSSKDFQKDIDIVRELKEKEELFVKELELNCGIKRTSNNNKTVNCDISVDNLSHSNKTNNDLNSSQNNEDLLISKNENLKTKIFEVKEPISNKSSPKPVRRIVKKKDKKPISPTKLHNLDYCNITPEKNLSFNVTNFFSPRETLSQQNEKILCDIDQYNTKTHNLTAAELYDLSKDFAPQPGTSRMDEESENYSSNFSYNDISLMDSTFLLNTPNSQQINQNISVLDLTVTGDCNSNIWMPKYFPPSRSDIISSLALYNIPENRFQEPFYSDYSDVTGKVDIGHNVLKISSTTAKDLEYFESCIGFIGIEKWRKDKFKEFYSQENVENIKVTLASHKKIILTPVNLPPRRKEVISWIHMKNNEASKKLVEKIEKPRIIIPQSPGNESFSDMSLSPCTPASLAGSPNVIESSQDCTPVSSKCSSPNIARKAKSKKRGTLQRKVLFSQSKQKAQEELKLMNITENNSGNDSCQITGVTLDNTHGFQMSYENLQDAKARSEHQYLTILVVEVHICTRGDFFPDPQYDSVRAIFYSIMNDVPENFSLPSKETGVIVVDTLPGTPTKQTTPILEGTGAKCQIIYVKSEFELIDEFIKLIRKWDPDIFVGFEIEMLSWGYLIDRCSVIGINLSVQISRTNPAIIKNKTGENKQEELKLNGRIILDAWRLFRHEIALQSYTFENLMYHILHQRVPAHSFRNLSFWWEYRSNYFRYITVNYYITRVEGILQLLDQLDLIGRTSELAKLFGIQFFEVLSRGSQFRVESMMLRLAKPLNYIPISPSVQQRAKMRAPESLPLILEPESRFYVDPVIVLDFQSLYPSIIIAYNYCFSTCIGRVEKLGTNSAFDFGACQLKISRSRVQKLHNKINFSPCGVGFVKPEIRQGILPRMLKEILETRLMVKSSMKENKENKLLQRVLHNRQLGLKLIANVTYGYTSANFSGRMPCIEVGDSVVSKGRETLERAIHLIETTEKWRARVVYGDTDSLFVLVPGRSREDAFKIGAEIAEAVTNDNPPPVKLKLEKVYQPCILQTKKRYVGYMYESPDQKEPEYNAKGIETVRRDGCPAVAKMLEKTLRLLFETRDVSLVKRYVVRQFEKLITGRASIQDLIFAREFRGFGGYRPGACVPALELAKKWIAVDKRREPRRSERVPYIVVNGPPGLPLIRLVKCPRELLNQEQGISLRPNAVYYITKVIIPPLNRCLGLIGANVLAWYNEMPRKQLQILPTDIHFERSKKSTISQYFVTMSCIVCNNQTRDGLCDDCINNPQQTVVVLQEKLRQWERSFDDIKQVCRSCCGRVEYTDCTSLDCPVLYRLSQTKRDLKQVPFVRNLLSKFL